MNAERLSKPAIMRGGKLHTGKKAHWDIRAALGDENPTTPNLNDVEGFVTSTGRFVTRAEAKKIGIAAGQLHSSWEKATRDVLSSDIRW